MKTTKAFKMNLYVVYDTIAEESGPVFEAKNDGVASRQYRGILAKNTLFEKEFRLINIGTIDKEINIIKQSSVYTVTIPDNEEK